MRGIGTRELDDAHYERAIGYPRERRPGSCLVTNGGVEDLADIDASLRDLLLMLTLVRADVNKQHIPSQQNQLTSHGGK